MSPGGAAGKRVVRVIELVPVGRLDDEEALLSWLSGELQARLGIPARPGERLEPRESWRDPGRGQLSSNAVVDALIERDAPGEGPPPSRWALAVTEEDLFAPDRTFVFGEAAQDGAWAVISLARLREGEGIGAPRVRARVFTEALHELGHVAGLGHCERPGCVMFPSTTLADTDRKGPAACPPCARVLARVAGVDRAPGSR